MRLAVSSPCIFTPPPPPVSVCPSLPVKIPPKCLRENLPRGRSTHAGTHTRQRNTVTYTITCCHYGLCAPAGKRNARTPHSRDRTRDVGSRDTRDARRILPKSLRGSRTRAHNGRRSAGATRAAYKSVCDSHDAHARRNVNSAARRNVALPRVFLVFLGLLSLLRVLSL